MKQSTSSGIKRPGNGGTSPKLQSWDRLALYLKPPPSKIHRLPRLQPSKLIASAATDFILDDSPPTEDSTTPCQSQILVGYPSWDDPPFPWENTQ